MIGDNKYGSDIFHLEIDETAKANMLETARWAKFLTIVFFIFFSLLVISWLVLLVMFTNFTDKNQALGLIWGAIVIGVNVYPAYALYKFSSLLKLGVGTANQEQFNRALSYQKNMFKYMGILTIVGLVFYGLVLLLAVMNFI